MPQWTENPYFENYFIADEPAIHVVPTRTTIVTEDRIEEILMNLHDYIVEHDPSDTTKDEFVSLITEDDE